MKKPMPGEPMTDSNTLPTDKLADLLSEFDRERMIQKSIPTMIKNEICQFLLFKLQQHFSMEEDLVLNTLFNVGVRTGLKTSRVPMLVVCEPQVWRVLRQRSGPAVLNFGEIPLLVIEMPENRADYLLKKAEYALLEIPEVWMIDPEKQRLQALTNPTNENGYDHQNFVGKEQIVSTQFPNLELTVAEICKPQAYAKLMQEEVDANVGLQDDFSLEWQQMTLARSEYEELREKYAELEVLVHNELQEKAVLLELLEEKGIDLEAELTPGEFAMLQDDIAARQLKEENESLSEQVGDEELSEELKNEVIEAAISTYETELHRV
jgi:Uma2 family endonuclease